MTKTRVEEIKDPQGGRNYIRHGDGVKVTAGPGDKQSFKARFMYAVVDDDGVIVEVTVYGGKGFDPAKPDMEQDAVVKTRTLRPCRIRRMSQATIEARKQ